MPLDGGGFDYLASCRRLCGAYRKEPIDRVPIPSPIPWQLYDDIDGTAFGDWRDEERFRRIARLVQKHCDPKPQARIHVHCHARVRTLLDSFVEMGVDSTDPVEPLPQGNADIAEVKERYDGKLVFLGNIEFLAMETLQPDEIEALVRRAIEAGGKRNVILMPSAGPHQRPTDLLLANAERYIEAGLRYGRL